MAASCSVWQQQEGAGMVQNPWTYVLYAQRQAQSGGQHQASMVAMGFGVGSMQKTLRGMPLNGSQQQQHFWFKIVALLL
jgi:hypothetical protein